MRRLFLGIPLSPELSEVLVACKNACVRNDPAWAAEKWVSPTNLHITLRYFGPLADEAASLVASAAAEAIADVTPFDLRIAAARVVPRQRSASMIWAVPSQGIEPVTLIADRIAGIPLGEPPDPERAFLPHVTLCRARRSRPVAAAAIEAMTDVLHQAGIRRTTMSVDHVTLFASTLTRRGPVYEDLSRIRIGRAD